MFKILMPVDFSACSLKAFSYAGQMIRALEADLILLHVVEPIGGDATMFVDESMIEDEITEAQNRLEGLRKSSTEAGSPVIKTVAITGFPLEKILEVAENEGISMIIMGTNGANGQWQEILGSNTYNVVKKAKCAVLTVPYNTKAFKIKKIGLAVELQNKENVHLLTIIKHIARYFGAEVIFLHVFKEDDISLEHNVKPDAVLWLSDQFKSFKNSFQNFPSENVANAISEYAVNNNIDLLTISPQKHGLFNTLFHRSTTRKLVLHSHFPVLTLPADF